MFSLPRIRFHSEERQRGLPPTETNFTRGNQRMLIKRNMRSSQYNPFLLELPKTVYVVKVKTLVSTRASLLAVLSSILRLAL